MVGPHAEGDAVATKTTVHEVIEDFRTATSNVERGEKFERLMVDYFFLDPTLAVEYDEVQRWPEWDHREGTHDSDIDLVARSKDTGEWTAIQCKFYDHYETVEPYPPHEQAVAGLGDWVAYRVEKMRWADKTTKGNLYLPGTHMVCTFAPIRTAEIRSPTCLRRTNA